MPSVHQREKEIQGIKTHILLEPPIFVSVEDDGGFVAAVRTDMSM